jgi:hypothetical protein
MKRSTIGLVSWMFGVVAAFCGGGLLPEPASATADAAPPLAALPSRPGGHIDKIKALGDNEWLSLGPPAPDPVCGSGRGRTWSAKMPYAPDLRGAFLFGEGVHGFVKPDGHYMDDLWFYDLNAHRWICLYPGWNLKKNLERIRSGDLAFDGHGFIVDRVGRMQPPAATMVHAYNMVEYDPNRRKFAFVGYQFSGYSGALGPAKELLLQSHPQPITDPGFAPWLYDVASDRFERYPVKIWPRSHSFFVLEYVSSRRQLFWPTDDDKAWYYDIDLHQWMAQPARGPRPGGIDHSGCYDTKRDRVYVGGGGYNNAKTANDNFFAFDVRTNTWSKPNAAGKGPIGFNSHSTIFTCDTVHELVILITNQAEYGADYTKWQVQIYNPDANTWLEPEDVPPTVGGKNLAPHGFHVPDLNAYILFFAQDSDDRGTIWAYRYKTNPRKTKIP